MHFLDDVFKYVMRNKAVMPRRALRYAMHAFIPIDFCQP